MKHEDEVKKLQNEKHVENLEFIAIDMEHAELEPAEVDHVNLRKHKAIDIVIVEEPQFIAVPAVVEVFGHSLLRRHCIVGGIGVGQLFVG